MPSHAHTLTPGLALPGIRPQLSRLMRDLRVWYVARQTRIALSQLSPRQLDDLGLTGADIDAVARRVARQ